MWKATLACRMLGTRCSLQQAVRKVVDADAPWSCTSHLGRRVDRCRPSRLTGHPRIVATATTASTGGTSTTNLAVAPSSCRRAGGPLLVMGDALVHLDELMLIVSTMELVERDLRPHVGELGLQFDNLRAG